MTMNTPSSREDLIASLSENMAPVTPVRAEQGGLLIGLATAIAAIASIAGFGFWFGMIEGEASGFFWIVNGLLLLVGTASAIGVVASALPRVGARGDAPLWGAAMLGVVPLAAIIMLLTAEPAGEHAHSLFYWPCAVSSLAAALVVGAAAVLFLRRGAPVSIERAGWLTGLAAGALGSVAYGITCPLDDLAHVGLVHIVPVGIAALVGRLVVPPLIRW